MLNSSSWRCILECRTVTCPLSDTLKSFMQAQCLMWVHAKAYQSASHAYIAQGGGSGISLTERSSRQLTIRRVPGKVCLRCDQAGLIAGPLMHPDLEVWPQVFKRVDITKREEEYQLIGTFDKEPDGSVLTPLFSGRPQGAQKPWWQI